VRGAGGSPLITDENFTQDSRPAYERVALEWRFSPRTNWLAHPNKVCYDHLSAS